MINVRKVDSTVDRLPPQNIEAEQSVLGAIILDNDALPRALDMVSPDDFYRDSHRRLYEAMLGLFDRNEPIDVITITDYLNRKGQLEAVGGISYLSELAAFVPTSANIRYHAKIIREKALLRALVQTDL